MTDTELAARIDAYFARRFTDRAGLFREIAAWRPTVKAAEPIVKAIGLVGARAADESLMALRLILGGRPADDDSVGRLRRAVAELKSGGTGGEAAYAAAIGART